MKYSCDKAKKMLSLYIDDELSKSQKKYVAEHLLNCADCRQEYDHLKFIVSELNVTPIQPLPLDFKEKLHNRLVMESSVAKKKPLNLKMYSSIAAGLILTVLIGTGYYQRFQPVEIAYISDAPLNYDEKTAVIEQKQSPLPTETPTKTTAPKQKPVQSKEVTKDIPVTPSNNDTTKETIIDPPKVPTEKIASNVVAPVATQGPAPTTSPEVSSGSGGGSSTPMIAMSAKTFAEPIYKTANIKVNNFTACADEINKKYGSTIENGTIVLYVSDQDLENILKIVQKYNSTITYDNVSSKNETNKCIISVK